MRWFWAGLIGATCLFEGGWARAQCTKDVECEGDRVCSKGECVDPEPVVEPSPAPAPAKLDGDDHFFTDGERPYKPKKHIKNPGLLAAGIALAASGPIVVVVAAATSTCDVHECDIDHRVAVASLGALVLVGLGVPLIVVGAKRAPVGQALLVPWAGPTSAGVTLDLRL